MDFRKDFYALGAGVRQSLKFDELKRVQIHLPAFNKQRAIADYLDRETARIDALITKKQRMIELFKDRRQALITSAVTGGTTSQGGGVTRLRHLAKINPATPGFDRVSDGALISFAPLEAVWSDGLDLSRKKAKSEVSTGYTRFQEGDIVVPKITPTFQADRATIAFGVDGGVAAGTTELHVVRVNPGVDRRYVRYLLSSREFLVGGEAEMIGVAGQKRVPDAWLRDFRVPILDVERQRVIADFLDRETARIDAITVTLERQIVLLRERRQALITAAVMGELDVSGVAA
jgi:restriction endonuclease S subunit